MSFFQSNCPLIDTVCSDASGSSGCGAYTQSGSPAWLQTKWPPTWVKVSIAVKELLPIVLAAAVWGRRWRHGRVLFRSDNQAMVAALFSRTTRDGALMHLLRCLFFLEFDHRVEHVAGVTNTAADALSRDRLPTFRSLVPQAELNPTAIPEPLLELLSDRKLTWISPRDLWEDFFREV